MLTHVVLHSWVQVEVKHKEASSSLVSLQLQRVNKRKSILAIEIRLLIYRAIASAIQEQYQMDKKLVSKIKVKYDVDACLITLDVKRNVGNQTHELSQLANYMEKDVNMQLLFDDLVKIEQTIAGEKLEMESIQAYYVGEEAASTTTQTLSGTMLTLSVALILAVLLGLLIQ
ncbi:hypothetical protein P4O66_011010, partial [Electrophorus voltai]